MTSHGPTPPPRRLGRRGALLLSVLLFAAPAGAGEVLPFRAPPETERPAGPGADLVRLGRRIATHTPAELPDLGGNALRCSNCHLKAGTVPYAAPWVGAPARYPRYSARNARQVDLRERIQGCFQRSLNGKAPRKDSRAMDALVAYIRWLSKDLPPGATVEGRGMPMLDEPAVPDRRRGARLYLDRCAVCHGEDGAGRLDQKPPRYPYGFPPLWGPRSFNIAAGMARLHKAAAFIQRNMPLAAGGTLTVQEAYDIADFVIHQPRPDFPGKERDWPKGGKPEDARY
ncbi:c-type cytochrome [Dissulfurirhabdus thermomarina]|uniref:C-type cytochrome n=1 Tax=Dissulfurirhabdus thermomarina TaxID=1765737 RepID=A0A6N9TN27_DISTH|nr:c-type cytochrome [Dissulfurirhabdus thermomarina]NDY42645.1 c-type cytochrome [Dissulfurirhabdus thermomarina]NMX23097.1 c-type cytochrome [Dissulfurirhabdus thermomarina]